MIHSAIVCESEKREREKNQVLYLACENFDSSFNGSSEQMR